MQNQAIPLAPLRRALKKTMDNFGVPRFYQRKNPLQVVQKQIVQLVTHLAEMGLLVRTRLGAKPRVRKESKKDESGAGRRAVSKLPRLKIRGKDLLTAFSVLNTDNDFQQFHPVLTPSPEELKSFRPERQRRVKRAKKHSDASKSEKKGKKSRKSEKKSEKKKPATE